MTQYYVNPSGGNNSNSGLSTSQAWQTFARAQQSPVGAGDIVNLMSGSYGTESFSGSSVRGNSSNWITYRQYLGHSEFSADFGKINFSGNYNWYIRIEGIESVVSSSSDACIKVNNGGYVYIEGCKIRGTAWNNGPSYSHVLFENNSRYCTVDNSEIYWGETDTLAAVQIDFSDYCTVRYCLVHDMPGTALRINWDTENDNVSYGSLLEYNVIHTNSPLPAHGGSGVTMRCENVTVRGNVIYNYGQTRPIRSYQSVHPQTGYSNLTIENNVIYYMPPYDNQWMHWCQFIDAGQNFILRNNTFAHYWVSGIADAGVTIGYAQSSHLSSWQIYNNIFETKLEIYASSSLCSNIQQGNNIFNSYGGGDTRYGLWISGSKVSSFPGGNNGSWWTSNFAQGIMFQEKAGNYPFGSIYPFELCAGSPAINAGNTSRAPTLDLLGRSRVGTADIGAYEYGGEPPEEPETLYINVSDDIDIAEIPSTQKEGGLYQVDVSETVTVSETEIVDVGPKKVNVSDSVGVSGILTVDAPEGETALKFVSVVDTISIAEELTDRYVFGPVLLTISVTESITIQELPKAVNESLLGGGFPNWYLATTDGSYASGKAYTSDDAGQNWTEVSPANADFAIRVYGQELESEVFEINITEPVSVNETVDREAKDPALHNAYPTSSITVSESVSLDVLSSAACNIEDSVSVVEVVTLLMTTLREIAVTDTISIAETSRAAKSLDVSVSDSVSVAESTQELITDLNVSVSDSLSVVSWYENKITNGDFSAWTNDDPDNWTVFVSGGETSTNYINEDSGRCHFVAAGDRAVTLTKSGIIEQGRLYNVRLNIISITGSMNVWVAGITTSFDSTGQKEFVVTAGALGTDFIIARNPACDVIFDDVVCRETSVKAIIPLLHASVVDTIGIYDFAPVQKTEETYVVFVDSITVADTVSAWVSGVDATVTEPIVVAETTSIKIKELHVSVVDSVTVVDNPMRTLVSSLNASAVESISISESIVKLSLPILHVSAIETLVVGENLMFFKPLLKIEYTDYIAVQDVLSRLNVNSLEFYADDEVAVSDWGYSEKIAIPKEATDLVTVGETIDLKISRPGWAKRPPRKPHPIHPREVRYS